MRHQNSRVAGSSRAPSGTGVKWPYVAAAPALMLMSLAATPSLGEEPDSSSLQKEMEELRQEVQTLKEQVKSLQQAPVASPPAQAPPIAKEPPTAQPAPEAAPVKEAAPEPAPTAAGAKEAAPASPRAQPTPSAAPSAPSARAPVDSLVALRVNWAQVKKGMTQSEIAALLGAPTTEMRINGKLVWYYYYAGVGGSSVFFNDNGHVSSMQGPTNGWW